MRGALSARVCGRAIGVAGVDNPGLHAPARQHAPPAHLSLQPSAAGGGGGGGMGGMDQVRRMIRHAQKGSDSDDDSDDPDAGW